MPPEFLKTQGINDNFLEMVSRDDSDANDSEAKLSVISSVPFKKRSDILSQQSINSQTSWKNERSPTNFRNKIDPVQYQEDAILDKAALLQEIKQLQMLNPQTCILSREFTMSDSYETIQLGLYQAKQSIDIASGVNTMKDVLKVGCTGIELGCNKFAKNYVDLNGWSTEVAGSIDG